MLKIEDPMNTPLPKLRGDLQIYRGPDDGDGTPTYNIHDPITNTYFKISWVEAEVIHRMRKKINVKDLVKELSDSTTIKITPEEVLQFFKLLQFQGLLEEFQHPASLEDKRNKMKQGWFMWLAYNYLFFKIPLVKPDRFLSRTLPYVLPFLSVNAFIAYIIIIFFGLGLVLTNWSNFIGTFTYFFNPAGIAIYAVAIFITKVLHELGHAYTAKKYGLHVPTMGVAILLLWPILYTDATDAWKLHNRKQRLIISAAGIMVELVLAGLCTILWTMTNPGLLQSVFFVLASLNWVTTIFINLNPAMRYDGYYITSDLLGVENLQTRCFNLLRYDFYRVVAGADLPDPEPKLAKRTKHILLGLAIYTWFYRLFLYTAIALFVYYKFTKLLGIFLFMLEIAIFFVWPVVYEVQFVHKIRDKIKWNWRLRIVSFVVITFLIWFIVPWPIRASSPAIVVPGANQVIYAPLEGIIKKIYIERGQEIAAGDPILDIQSQELDHQISVLEKEIAILGKKIEITELTDKNLPFYMETQSQMIQKEAELQGAQSRRDLDVLRAKVSGKIYDWDEWLREGEAVKKDQKLGEIASLSNMDLIAFVFEDDAEYVSVGDTVEFTPVSMQDSYWGQVVQVSPVRVQKLRYDQLSSLHGGEIAVNTEKEMIDSYYAVQIHLENPETLRFGLTGTIRFWGPWRSRAFLLIDYVYKGLIRESGV